MGSTAAKSLAFLLCAALVTAFLVQGWMCIRTKSQTFDEAGHITAGYSFLARKDFRLYREHPALIRELCALPVYLLYRLPFQPEEPLWQSAEMWAISRDFLHGSRVAAEDILTAARLPNLALGAALTALVGWWSYRLWGAGAAVVGTALAAFEPNLVAHASLVGTDLGITLFTFLTLYLLWEYGNTRSFLLLAATGVALGLALTTKFSGMLLVVMVSGLLAAHVAFRRSPLRREESMPPPRRRRFAESVRMGIVLAAGAAVVFPAVYFFQGVAPWLDGLRWQLAKLGVGHPGYFLGEYSDKGWWTYFLVAFLIKTPVGSLALLAASLLLFRCGQPLGRREALFLFLPVVTFLIAVVRGKVDVGVRYLLPIYPFLFVLASRLATLSWGHVGVGAVVLGLPLAATAGSVLRIAPHQLAYSNELIGGPEEGWHYLGDSNIDWGQDLRGVRDYMEREQVPMVYLSYFGTAPPEAYGIRYQAAPVGSPVTWPEKRTELLPPGTSRELLVISVTNLQGIYLTDRALYAWLRERRPVERIGYSIHVYELTGDPTAHLRLAEDYLNAAAKELPASSQRLELARGELQRVIGLDVNDGEAARRARELLRHHFSQ
jgi:hypothetical protein